MTIRELTLNFCAPLDECCATLIMHLKEDDQVLSGDGMLLGKITSQSGCSGRYSYVVSYDDALLTDPTMLVSPCDIEKSCCYDCVAEYADKRMTALENFEFIVTGGPDALTITSGPFTIQSGERLHFYDNNGITVSVTNGSALIGIGLLLSADAGNSAVFGTDGGLLVPAVVAPVIPIQTATDTATVDHVITGTDLTSNVKISATAGNLIVANADGIYVSSDLFQTVLDTATVDLTLAGTVLSADAKISATAGNIIVANADGLYAPTTTVPVQTILDTATVDLVLTGTQLSANAKLSATAGNALVANLDGLYVPSAVAQTPLTPVDTASVNLTVSGVDNHTIQADVLIDTTVFGNQLVELPTGLFVPAPPVAIIPIETVTDTASIDHTLTGTDLTSDVKISATAGNVLVINPDGLFVPTGAETALTVVDTALVNLTASGVSNHTLQADILPSANDGDVLTTVLGVPTWATPAAGAQTPVTVNDSSSIDFTASGVDNHTVTGVVKVSATAGNQVSINPDGLFVPADLIQTVTDTCSVNLTLTGTALSADLIPATGPAISQEIPGYFDISAGGCPQYSCSINRPVETTAGFANLIAKNAAGCEVEVQKVVARATNYVDSTLIPPLVQTRANYTNIVTDPLGIITPGVGSWNAVIPFDGIYYISAAVYVFLSVPGNSNWGTFAPGTVANVGIFLKVNGVFTSYGEVTPTSAPGMDAPAHPQTSYVGFLTAGDIITVDWQHSDNTFQHGTYDDIVRRSWFNLVRLG
jgi:hypothetical protein